jgi:dipeptidyl aminopeptidase/acylaminoacyl peptidase
MHDSIQAAVQKVIELGYADESKIGFEGFSYGGHAAMFIATQDNPFAAIVAGAGVSNLVQGFSSDIVRGGKGEQGYYMTGQGRMGQAPNDAIETYVSESPINHVKNLTTPTLLYHGTADNIVVWEHSFAFYNLARFYKKPVIMLSYKGEGHGLKEDANKKDLQVRLKAFFDHYLKDKEAPEWITKGLPYKATESSDDNGSSGKPWL